MRFSLIASILVLFILIGSFSLAADLDKEPILDINKTIIDVIFNGTQNVNQGKWISPGDRSFVNKVDNTVETLYGNFSYIKGKGILLKKDGVDLGILNVEVDSIKPKDPTYVLECDKVSCKMTLDYGDSGKFIVDIGKFEAHVFYEYENKLESSVSKEFSFNLETNTTVNLLSSSSNKTAYNNGMVFDYQDIVLLTGTGVTTEFLTNVSKIITAPITFKSLEKIIIDPTWSSPSSVSSYMEQDSSYPATNSVDGDTSTYWTSNIASTFDYSVTYDLGDTYTVSQIRIYADGDAGESFPFGRGDPCNVNVLKVCDDSACSGESDLVGTCAFSTTKEWQECDFTDTDGRYIYVEGYASDGSSCATGNYLGDPGASLGFWEFEAETTVISNVLNDSQVYMSFDDDDLVGSNPKDLSGNDINFTTYGPTTGVTGKLNEAFSFDGTNDKLYYAADNLLPASISSDYWVKFDTIPLAQHQFVFGKRQTSGGHSSISNFVLSGGNKMRFYIGNGGSESYIESNLTMTADTWYHVVSTYDQTTMRLYINNNQVAVGTARSGAIAYSNTYDWTVGTYDTLTWRLRGDIDEFAIYNRSLSVAEINASYNGGTGFNPYAGTTPTDSCTFPGINLDWEINMTDHCNLTSTAHNLGTGKMSFVGDAGYLRIGATITTTDLGIPPSDTTVWMLSNASILVK